MIDRLLGHRAELEDFEHPSVEADAPLAEEDRAR
jgi:hypothetical protein